MDNKDILDLMSEYINYKNVYFVANGSKKICDWVIDIAHNDIKEPFRMMTVEEIKKRTLYVSDDILFNVSEYYSKYSYLGKKSKMNKLIFIGYLQGSVAKNRIKILPIMFKENLHKIPTDIIGPGAKDLKIDRDDVNCINNSIYGKEFFETLNSYLGYIFIGKGNPVNKYINKTVYDCISARCPVIVYSKCDETGVIFKDREFYFSNETELKAIYEKLKDPKIRENWIDRQYEEIRYKLDTLMDNMFHFKDICKQTEGVKPDLKLVSLF